ncbi:MAG: MarR family transcriptional regulator [Bryobacter sp.]|nr:MarR family transcriptional regulator [Bryobacter sp.]
MSLRMVCRVLTNRYDKAMAEAGLTATQYFLMMVIRGHGQIKVTALAKFAELDQTTATRGLQVLEKNGWVRRVEGEDKRNRAVELTAGGEEVLGQAKVKWERVQGETLREIGRERWVETQALLGKIVQGRRDDEDSVV